MIDGESPTPMAQVKYLLMTAWGHREGKTDDSGILIEKGMRTGGLCLIANGTTFVSSKQVELNWNHG
ncbi:MAG TPA: hypothetical protein VN764_14675 [Polyangiaceae bacterium]|nr:hypothetical protein [Polyangiaceae bacterium]